MSVQQPVSGAAFGRSWNEPLTPEQQAALPKTVLQFSGGKDSLACLYMLEPHWPEITVAWSNTGAAFPEVLELMTRIRSTVPHFLEVRANVHRDIGQYGWPVDIVPVESTLQGQLITGGEALAESSSLPDVGRRGLRMRSWADCCTANWWLPMHRKMVELGAKKIIRGQRKAEAYKAPIRSGQIIDGIEFFLPLEDWTTEQVIAYLRHRNITLPANYEHMGTSLDCWCCTAYLQLHQGRLAYMKARHPQLHAKVHETMTRLYGEIDDQVNRIRKLAAKELETTRSREG